MKLQNMKKPLYSAAFIDYFALKKQPYKVIMFSAILNLLLHDLNKVPAGIVKDSDCEFAHFVGSIVNCTPFSLNRSYSLRISSTPNMVAGMPSAKIFF